MTSTKGTADLLTTVYSQVVHISRDLWEQGQTLKSTTILQRFLSYGHKSLIRKTQTALLFFSSGPIIL